MPHEDYVPAPTGPDYTFDPATLYGTPPPLARTARLVEPPVPLSSRAVKTALFAVLLGVSSLLVGENRLARAAATSGWIETHAVILSSKLQGTTGGDYHLETVYSYRTGPRDRQGSRIAFEPDVSREGAYAYAQRFRPGANVTAWFDPAQPNSVVLEQPKIPAPWAPTLLGAALLLGGLTPFARQLIRHVIYRRSL